MCGLCGVLSVEEHWLVSSSNRHAQRDVRLRLRRERIALINSWLAPLKIKVSDFHGSAYILAGSTGRQEIIQDIGQLWSMAEQMSSTMIDPLNDAYLALIDNEKG